MTSRVLCCSTDLIWDQQMLLFGPLISYEIIWNLPFHWSHMRSPQTRIVLHIACSTGISQPFLSRHYTLLHKQYYDMQSQRVCTCRIITFEICARTDTYARATICKISRKNLDEGATPILIIHLLRGGGPKLIFSTIMIFELEPGMKCLAPKDHFKPILGKCHVFHMGAAGRDLIWAYFVSLKIGYEINN